MKSRQIIWLSVFGLWALVVSAIFTVNRLNPGLSNQAPELDKPRQIPIKDTLWLEELTWIEILDLSTPGMTR